MKHTSNGINILGKDVSQPSQQGHGLRIENNLFLEIDKALGGDGEFVKISNMPDTVVDHNTVFHNGNMITVYGPQSTGFVFTNNIIKHNSYGIIGQNQGSGIPTINAYLRGAIIRRNLIVGADASIYPAENAYPARLPKVVEVDPRKGEYRSVPDVSYQRKATDGKDMGCDFDALNAAVAGVAGR